MKFQKINNFTPPTPSPKLEDLEPGQIIVIRDSPYDEIGVGETHAIHRIEGDRIYIESEPDFYFYKEEITIRKGIL